MSLRVLLLLASMLTLGGCRHHTRPTLSLSPPAFPDLQIEPSMPAFTLVTPEPPSIDLAWLDSDEFLPPGATRLGGKGLPASVLRVPTFVRYPAAEECTAPDNRSMLVCQSMGSDRLAVHWLQLRRRDSRVETSLFRTPKAFEVTWSPDSRHVAITHAVGENRSEVVVTNSQRELNPPSLDLRSELARHLVESQLDAPCFIKVYRWTTTSALVVRGIGRTLAEPFTQFGFEVLIEPQLAGEPMPQFLRGFTRTVAGLPRGEAATEVVR